MHYFYLSKVSTSDIVSVPLMMTCTDTYIGHVLRKTFWLQICSVTKMAATILTKKPSEVALSVTNKENEVT